MWGNRRRGGGELGLLFLFLEIARVGIDHIPPVTLGVLGINVLFHLASPLNLEITDACINCVHIIHHLELHRLVLAAIYHASDFHLYYNMSSFLWKGRKLEPLVGSWTFACMIVTFAIGTSVLMVAASYLLLHYANYADPFYTCAAGFSGVLFGLKVVVNELSPDAHGYVFGFPVEMRYVAWVELLVIHLLVPNASFLGHLCGIFMGYAYIHGYLSGIFQIFTAIQAAFQPRPVAQAYFDANHYNAQPNRYPNYNVNPNPPNNNVNHNANNINNANIINNVNNAGNNDNNARNNDNSAQINANNPQNNANNPQNNDDNAQNNDNNNGGYANPGEGFYNRYRNYDYNRNRPPNGLRNRGENEINQRRNTTLVNGWLER